MHRIKSIAQILEGLAVVALSSAVQPDGNQRQQRQSLLTDLKFVSEQVNGIHQTTQHLHIDPVKRKELSQQAPPFPSSCEFIVSSF